MSEVFILSQMQVQLSDLQQRLAKEEEEKVSVVQINEKLQNTSDQLDKVLLTTNDPVSLSYFYKILLSPSLHFQIISMLGSFINYTKV